MCIIVHGVDVVDVENFSKLIEKGGEEFLKRCFLATEISAASYKRCERLAGWFAVKEAILKSIGTGMSDGASFVDIQVIHDEVGAPSVMINGRTREIAESLGIKKWLVSISHTEKIAFASVVGQS